jgi:hypothetical protein
MNHPDDGPGERRARHFLHYAMTRYPNRLRQKSGEGSFKKDDYLLWCQKRCGISGRRFDAIWRWSAEETKADAWTKHGPRGPGIKLKNSPQ